LTDFVEILHGYAPQASWAATISGNYKSKMAAGLDYMSKFNQEL